MQRPWRYRSLDHGHRLLVPVFLFLKCKNHHIALPGGPLEEFHVHSEIEGGGSWEIKKTR